jgi:hypothetical protein
VLGRWKAPTPIFAFVAAIVSGTLLAVGEYVGAVVLACIGILLLAAWQFAEARGDDDEHGFW